MRYHYMVDKDPASGQCSHMCFAKPRSDCFPLIDQRCGVPLPCNSMLLTAWPLTPCTRRADHLVTIVLRGHVCRDLVGRWSLLDSFHVQVHDEADPCRRWSLHSSLEDVGSSQFIDGMTNPVTKLVEDFKTFRCSTPSRVSSHEGRVK